MNFEFWVWMFSWLTAMAVIGVGLRFIWVGLKMQRQAGKGLDQRAVALDDRAASLDQREADIDKNAEAKEYSLFVCGAYYEKKKSGKTDETISAEWGRGRTFLTDRKKEWRQHGWKRYSDWLETRRKRR